MLTSVVLPAPRKPVTTVMGILLSVLDILYFVCCTWLDQNQYTPRMKRNGKQGEVNYINLFSFYDSILSHLEYMYSSK